MVDTYSLSYFPLVYETNFFAGPADYGAVNQVITFTPQNEGDMLCVNIPIVDDNICEDDETFNVTITPNQPDCISIKPGFGEGTVTIVDDDSELIIKILTTKVNKQVLIRNYYRPFESIAEGMNTP